MMLVEGRTAIVIDDDTGYVNFGEHRDLCLGNLDHCSNGFTLAIWLLTPTQTGKKFFLSSGGQSTISHGIAVYKKDGKVGATFRTSSGRRWDADSSVVMDPTTWYHVVVTWHLTSGLTVYLDGVKVAEATVSTFSGAGTSRANLVLGRANNLNQESSEFTPYGYYDDMHIYYEEKSAAFINNII